MNPIPTDSRYVPLTQQKYCCVPTCIQIIMVRHGLPLVTAELLAYHLGLIVPEEDAPLFWQVRTGVRPPAGYGTQIGKPEFEPNKVFEELQIALHMNRRLIDSFSAYDEFEDYLVSVQKEDNDVLVCYDWGTLFGTDYQGGHVCVLDAITIEKDQVRIIDPEHDAPKWRIVEPKKLYEAMQFHGADKSAGFWELSLV